MSVERTKNPILRQMIVGAIIVNMFVVVLAIVLTTQSYHLHKDTAEVSARNISQILGQNLTSTTEKVNVALSAIVGTAKSQYGSVEDIKAILPSLQKNLSNIDSIGFSNANGDVIMQTGLAYAVGMNIGNRDYFQILRNTPGDGLVISKPLRGLVTRTWKITFARRLEGGDGSFQGVVYAEVMLPHIVEMFASLDVGKHGSLILRDANLDLVAHYPLVWDSEMEVSLSSVSEKFKKKIIENPNMGGFTAIIDSDVRYKAYAYYKISNLFYVIVCLDSIDYLAEWWVDVFEIIVVTVVFIFITILFVIVIARAWWRNAELLKFNSMVIAESAAGVLAYRDNGDCILANRAAADIVGCSEEQLLQQNFRTLSSWQEAGLLDAAEDVLASEDHRHMVVNCTSTFGKDFIIEVDFSIFMNNGKPHLLMVSRDVTVQKKLEQNLERERTLLRSLIDNIPDLIFFKDADSVYLGCNKAFEKFFGATEGKIIGKTDFDFVDEDMARFFRENDRATLASGTAQINEEWVTYPDGHVVCLETLKTPYLDHCGTVLGMLGISRDISERKQTEWALQERERHLKMLISVLPVGVFETDAKGQCTFVTSGWMEITGLSADAALGDGWRATLHPDDQEAVFQEWEGSVAAQRPFYLEYRFLRPDGEVRWVIGQSAAYFSASDELLGYVGSVTDITDRKKAEDAAHLLDVQLRNLFQLTPLGIALTDMQGRYLEFNEAFRAICGYSNEELRALDYWTLTPEKYRAQEVLHLESLERDGRYGPYEKEYLRKDGRLIPLRLNGVLMTTSNGEKQVWSIVEDVTEHKRAEEAIRLAALVYQASSEGMVVTDPDGNVISVNPAFTKITGYEAEEIIGQPIKVVNSGRHGKEFFEDMWADLLASGRWHGEIWNKRKNGEIYPERLTINSIFNEDGSVYHRVALFSDITDQKRSQETIWHQANFDALTGLANRRMFLERLDQEIKKSRRNGLPLALVFIDLDRFKAVNDTLGHDMGDQLLQEVAARLRSCLRETDVVGRLGGDEFTVILNDLDDVGSVDRVAETILEKLAVSYCFGADVAYVSASMGITFYPDDGNDAQTLLKNADQAMYESKNWGRNRFNYFKPSMQEAAVNRVSIANDLRVALFEQQFRIYYQPIVELATGAINKAEALIRWQHPKRGLVSPAEFIPIAEETGLITEIGEWVFREVAQQALRWSDAEHTALQISVNKSPVQFREEGMSKCTWASYLDSLGLPGGCIAVEITEGMLLEDNSNISAKLTDFNEAGIQVSLDDFGTGYSSLSYLKKFHIDYLKIDQSFVRGLGHDSSDKALCEAIIVMAHKLGMKVIGEGIETSEQRDLLTAAGCDYGQGYLFSKPVPAVDFERLLRSGKR